MLNYYVQDLQLNRLVIQSSMGLGKTFLYVFLKRAIPLLLIYPQTLKSDEAIHKAAPLALLVDEIYCVLDEASEFVLELKVLLALCLFLESLEWLV